MKRTPMDDPSAVAEDPAIAPLVDAQVLLTAQPWKVEYRIRERFPRKRGALKKVEAHFQEPLGTPVSPAIEEYWAVLARSPATDQFRAEKETKRDQSD